MPKLGLTMEEAMIIDWLVDDGAEVDVDQPIMLIETDKTETEVGSPGAGRLHRIGKRGDVYACGSTVAVLLAPGETAPSLGAEPAPVPAGSALAAAGGPTTPVTRATHAVAPTPSGRLLASPNARRLAAERGVALAGVRGTGPGGRIVSEDVEAVELVPAGGASPVVRADVRSVATAAARNRADLLGVDLAQVPLDPIERRITRDAVALHVRGLLQQLSGIPAPAPADAPASGAAARSMAWPLLQEPTEVIRLAGMRGTIAKRMHASLREMAQLTLTMDADMTAVLADRADRKAADPATPVPSITDYVVAAAARALLRHPRMNAQVTDAGIALLPEVHVGLAVAVDNGLMVPVVRDAAERSLAVLGSETTRLATACRAGTISPAELEGGTFSVSALGAFGVGSFTPVINPPNAGILGVGRLRDDLVLVDGQVTTVKRLTLSLTWDHRVVDGVPAAEFCRTVVDLLSTPAALA
jgi:pyruvate dehydrogenase E2 component (dihydrolipoamide acetyltransferase)